MIMMMGHEHKSFNNDDDPEHEQDNHNGQQVY